MRAYEIVRQDSKDTRRMRNSRCRCAAFRVPIHTRVLIAIDAETSTIHGATERGGVHVRVTSDRSALIRTAAATAMATSSLRTCMLRSGRARTRLRGALRRPGGDSIFARHPRRNYQHPGNWSRQAPWRRVVDYGDCIHVVDWPVRALEGSSARYPTSLPPWRHNRV